MYANFEVERSNRKAVLTFIREDRLNPLDSQMFQALISAPNEIDADSSVDILIIVGRGCAFVAGADINEYVDITVTDYVNFQRLGRRMYDRLESFRKPTIAAVNGPALGGGFELVLACDLAVAAENAKMGLPECKLGLLPGGGTQRLAKLVGRNKAKELLMTGDFITGTEAERLGIVNRADPAGMVLEEAHKLADRILERAPLTTQMAKQLVNDGLNASLPTAVTQEMG